MKNTMFMSKSERQERADKIWSYVTVAALMLGLGYVYVATFAFNTVKDSWAFVAWGAFSAITVLTCFVRNMIRSRE